MQPMYSTERRKLGRRKHLFILGTGASHPCYL